jgi:predicted metal-dependent phosphoesterase TrpH
MIDLHCHSHFSDGSLSPEAIVRKAVENQLHMLALTDHDTVAGLIDLHKAAQNQSLRIINGIELSTRWKKHDLHILGLNIDPEHDELLRLINQQNENRIARAKEISSRLTPFGVKNAYEKACAIAGHNRAGRPHFAQVIVSEGFAKDLQVAFKRYLGRGRPAYVSTPWLSVEQAVEGIVAAGGDAVLAHPLKYKLTRVKLHELIKSFKLVGGTGIEVVSGDMEKSQIIELGALCNRFGLLASTGSDFHGKGLSRVGLGQQQSLPMNCLPIWQHWIH